MSSDLDKSYEDGYREGYMYASEGFLKKMYAAIAKTLLDAGNTSEEVICFLKDTDHAFSVMYDADDEVQEIYDRIGVWLNIDRHAVDRVQEVKRE